MSLLQEPAVRSGRRGTFELNFPRGDWFKVRDIHGFGEALGALGPKHVVAAVFFEDYGAGGGFHTPSPSPPPPPAPSAWTIARTTNLIEEVFGYDIESSDSFRRVHLHSSIFVPNVPASNHHQSPTGSKHAASFFS